MFVCWSCNYGTMGPIRLTSRTGCQRTSDFCSERLGILSWLEGSWGYVKLIALIWFGIIIIVIIYSWVSPKAYRCLVWHVSFCLKHPGICGTLWPQSGGENRVAGIGTFGASCGGIHPLCRGTWHDAVGHGARVGGLALKGVYTLAAGEFWSWDMRIGTNCVSRVVGYTVYAYGTALCGTGQGVTRCKLIPLSNLCKSILCVHNSSIHGVRFRHRPKCWEIQLLARRHWERLTDEPFAASLGKSIPCHG